MSCGRSIKSATVQATQGWTAPSEGSVSTSPIRGLSPEPAPVITCPKREPRRRNKLFLRVNIPLLAALHKKSWAVIDRPYSLGFATVGALYERPRYICCAKPLLAEEGNTLEPSRWAPRYKRLFALKLCDSLFPIGVQSLGGVGAGEGLRQQFALEGEAFPLASLDSALDRSFDQPHGPARFVRRHELPRVTQHPVEAGRSFENLVNQSKVARLLEGDDAA